MFIFSYYSKWGCFMKNFKVYEVTEIMYDQQSDDVKYNVLFKYDVEKCENNKLKGAFKKINEPKGRVKEKIVLIK